VASHDNRSTVTSWPGCRKKKEKEEEGAGVSQASKDLKPPNRLHLFKGHHLPIASLWELSL
jgi:hypothetical protein